MLTGMVGNTTHATVTVHQENLTKGFTSKKSNTGKSLKYTEKQTTSTGSCTDDELREEGTYGGVSRCQQEHQTGTNKPVDKCNAWQVLPSPD